MNPLSRLYQLCGWWRDIEAGAGDPEDASRRAFHNKRVAAIKLAVFREVSRLESQGGPTDDDTDVRHGDERSSTGT